MCRRWSGGILEPMTEHRVLSDFQKANTMYYVQRQSPNKTMTINGWMTLASYKTKEDAKKAWASLMNEKMRIISRKQWQIEALS